MPSITPKPSRRKRVQKTAHLRRTEPFDVFAAWRALQEATLDVRAKMVGVVLLSHMNRATGECWPALARIVKLSSVPKSSACKALTALEDARLIGRRARENAPDRFESTVYTWIGDCPRGGQPAETVPSVDRGCPPERQPTVHRVDGDCPSRGHKHLSEQSISNNGENGGEEAPTLSPSDDEIWKVIQERHRERSLIVYGTPGIPRVKKEDREAMVTFVREAAMQARGEWPGPDKDKPLLFWCSYMMLEMLKLWFEREGSDGFLDQQAHPLRALAQDLGGIHAQWREVWIERLQEAGVSTF